MAGFTHGPTTTATWSYWNSTYTAQTSLPVYTGTTIVSSMNAVTWGQWNFVYEAGSAPVVPEAYERQRQEQQERQRLLVAERADANRRAEELLMSTLTQEQAASYRERGWFEVRGSRGGRWRIRKRGQSGNVDLMPEIGEEREASYCAHPPGGLPDADAHLAQMLYLMSDEDDFMRVANLNYRRQAVLCS